MNILVIEDDQNIAELIALHLRDLPADVTTKQQGWQGLDEALTGKYDFLVLDLMLPGLNGIEICRQIRQQNLTLPILMLTAKTEEQDKIAGLEIGADDYLTKPFSFGELQARVRSIMRRYKHDKHEQATKLGRIQYEELTLDLDRKTFHKGTDLIELTAKEFDLLSLFMQNAGRNYTRSEILERVWGEQFEGLEHTVNSNINRLRAKIENDSSEPRYLLTAWGIGYKFGRL